MKKLIKGLLAGLLSISCLGLYGCSNGTSDAEKVVIYSNADDEAVIAMKNALDNNGYADQYIFQTFGTSELGGKLMAEGSDIEADLITMSSFYVESAQNENEMFLDLSFDTNALTKYPEYYTPITAQEGAIIVNTEILKENNLEMPKSIKELTDPQYKGFISVTDIASSSTAWLLVQAVVDAYGDEEATAILKGIYENAGNHIEESGSAPLKKVRAGEVAIGFGLRHQAVADKEEGLPIDFVDAAEGTYSLTESVAIVDKGDKTNAKAMEMAQCIIENGRKELLNTYPIALYEKESQDSKNKSTNEKVFPEKLTLELLEKHQALSEAAKK